MLIKKIPHSQNNAGFFERSTEVPRVGIFPVRKPHTPKPIQASPVANIAKANMALPPILSFY